MTASPAVQAPATRAADYSPRVDAEDSLRYSERPYVCGVLGRPDPIVVSRLLAASPVPVAPVVDGPLLAAWASPGLVAWSGPAQTRGWHWGALVTGPSPTSPEQAMFDRVAAGVVAQPAGGAVHTDYLGLQDVYLRRVGDATYFSVRITPLLDLDDTLLHPDFAGWASALAMGGPIGETTPFTEVRRLRAGRTVTVGTSGQVAERPCPAWWETAATGPAPGVAELAERVAGALPSGRRRLAVTLTGGWDSRMLAASAVRQGHQLEAWTTRQFDGPDLDVAYSKPVATALGIPHQLVLPGRGAWHSYTELVRGRVEHQTWQHVWLQPLAVVMESQPLPVLDGLVGDLVLRSRVAGLALAESDDWAGPMFHALGGRRLSRAAPEHAGALYDAARAVWEAESAPMRDHPAGPVLAQLVTRTARVVSIAPRLVFGPELPVLAPFVHPEVLAPALRVPITEKRDGGFSRALLAAACGPLARLPSTNDPDLPPPGRTFGSTDPPVLRALAASVRECPPALGLLPPAMRVAVQKPVQVRRLSRQPRGITLLHWAGLLADWARTHSHRLDWSGWPVG